MSDDEVTLRVNTSEIDAVIRRIDAITTRLRTAPRGQTQGNGPRTNPRPAGAPPRPTRPGERRAPNPAAALPPEQETDDAGPVGPRRRSLRDRVRHIDPLAEAALAFPRRLVGGLVGLIAADRILDTILRGAQGQTFERIVRDTVRQLPGIATLDKVRQIVREQSKGDRVALLAEVDARIAQSISRRLSESPAAQREAARSAADAFERSPERREQLRRVAERRLGR